MRRTKRKDFEAPRHLVREAKTKKADPNLLKLMKTKISRRCDGHFNDLFQNKVGAFELGCHFFPKSI